MSTLASLPAGELTAAHHGWSIRIPAPGDVGHCDIKLGAIRRWTDNGRAIVGLLDTDMPSGSTRGTEHCLEAGTICTLNRKLRASRPRRGAYPPATPNPGIEEVAS